MCVREVIGIRGNPYIWDNGDFEYLKKSNNIFARKFNSGKSEIVDKIYDYIKKKVITEESNYNPKLSVIVPVYKVEKYLVRCIDSILAQNFLWIF